eukprot:Opistho-2@7375
MQDENRAPLSVLSGNVAPASTLQSRLKPPTRIVRVDNANLTPSDFPVNEAWKPSVPSMTTSDAMQFVLGEQTSAPSTAPTTTTQPQLSATSHLKRKASVTDLSKTALPTKTPRTTSATVKPVRKAPTTTVPRVAARTGVSATQKPTARKMDGAAAANAAADALRKKRAAWDYKGRLEDMEGMTEELKEEIRNSQGTVAQLTNQVVFSHEKMEMLERLRLQLESTVLVKERESTEVSTELSRMKARITDMESDHASTTALMRSRHAAEIEGLTMTHNALQRRYDESTEELRLAREEIMGLKSTISRMSTDAVAVESQLRSVRAALDSATDQNVHKDKEIASNNARIASLEASVAQLEARSRDEELVRRKLHNTIQELRGNIRVFCRVRPLLGGEVAEAQTSTTAAALDFPDQSLERKTIGVNDFGETFSGKSAKRTEFAFDRVFGPTSSQGEVFEEISQLVQSALDGYNVCIFAYGQTGSGKTFTMEGPPANQINDATIGMIPRAVAQIFESARALSSKGWTYEMEASFLEIYNETIRDLLGDGDPNKKHDIRLTPDGTGIYVTDATLCQVASEGAVFGLLKQANRNRAVAETQCNERSSRSHSVFRLRLVGRNSLTGDSSEGTLNLIDLAGSERLSSSGSKGDRLKETQCINKSLSNLGNVIMALANKDNHIPYRNSKLTHLLQNSLGGNSKTLMFVNVAPNRESLGETICSLRFATKVNSCQIGTAQQKKGAN